MPKAYASTVLNASADKVWAAIRDFNGLPGWHPGIADSAIEDGGSSDQVGAVRSMHLGDGAHIRERLLSLCDVTRSYSYNFETTPFAVLNYHATLRVTPVTDGDRAFVEWWTTFDCEPEKIAEWTDTFAGAVFKSGMDALKAKFGG
ncbi:MAG: SRPBCC family protein [Geminicoccaceae bacterium]